MATRNKSRGLDPTGTIPLSSVSSSSPGTSTNNAVAVVSSTNNNGKYSTGFSSRMSSNDSNLFDNQMQSLETTDAANTGMYDLAATIGPDKVSPSFFLSCPNYHLGFFFLGVSRQKILKCCHGHLFPGQQQTTELIL